MDLRDKHIKLSDELKSVKQQLKEREKELTCLYNLSKLSHNPEYGINDILSQTITLIPLGWRSPDLTLVKITYRDQVFQSSNFRETKWKLTASRNISEDLLSIEVHYLEEKDFLEEEKELLEEIADRLTIIIKKNSLEKEIQRLNKFYRKVLDGVISGVWISNKNDEIIYCNKNMAELANIPKEEIVGSNLYEDFPESTTKEFIKYYEKAKNTLKPIFYDNVLVFTPGKRRSLQFGWLVPLFNEDKYTHIICTVRDITKIEDIKEELKDRELRYDAIVSSNSIGVARVDMKGRPIETNAYLHEMLGYSADELKKVHFKEFTHPEDVNIDVHLFEELMVGEREYYHIEKRYIHKSGKIVWGDLTATLVRDSKDEPKYVISLVQDITEKKKIVSELKRSQKDLRNLTEELEDKVQERTKELERSEKEYKTAFQRVDFYKNLIAHDMNNILQNIRSSIELNSMYLEDPSKTEELREINKILKEQIIRAARLINNTRRLSQIEEEKIELHKVNLCEQLSRTVEFINKSYQSRKMNLNLNCDFETIIIKANDLIQDLFENLIMNAVKHNDSEIIEISIKVSIINIKENSRARIEFIDNGIGISDEKKKNLFKPNSKKTSSRGGMGLGLSLVKKILNIYGGEIWVENRVEGDYTQGSNFVVEFPVIK